MGQYGSHSSRSGDAGGVATTTSASAAEHAIAISTFTGKKIGQVERLNNAHGLLSRTDLRQLGLERRVVDAVQGSSRGRAARLQPAPRKPGRLPRAAQAL